MAASDTDREIIELIAAAAEDERQLDGRRYLELVAEHAERPLEAALRLVLSREGDVDEAELILTDHESSTTILLDTPADVEDLEPLDVHLTAESTDIHLEQADDGDYVLVLSLSLDLPGSEADG